MAWLYVPVGEGLNLGCHSPSETAARAFRSCAQALFLSYS